MSKRLAKEATATRATLDRERLLPQESARLKERLDRQLESRPARWPKRLALVGAAALIAFLVLRPDPTQSWFRIIEGGPCVHVDAEMLSASCPARISIEGPFDEAQLQAGAQLSFSSDRLTFHSGQARFNISPREKGQAPFELHVSHGSIVVLGTVFSVEQRINGGEVRLESGLIEFRWKLGASERLLPQARLAWPRVVPEKPKPVPVLQPSPPTPPATITEPAKRRIPPSSRQKAVKPKLIDPLDLNQVVDRLSRLRSQRRYREAAKLLRTAMAHPKIALADRERLSFELGEVLRKFELPQAICAHWREHLTAFPDGARQTAVQKRVQDCE